MRWMGSDEHWIFLAKNNNFSAGILNLLGKKSSFILKCKTHKSLPIILEEIENFVSFDRKARFSLNWDGFEGFNGFYFEEVIGKDRIAVLYLFLSEPPYREPWSI